VKAAGKDSFVITVVALSAWAALMEYFVKIASVGAAKTAPYGWTLNADSAKSLFAGIVTIHAGATTSMVCSNVTSAAGPPVKAAGKDSFVITVVALFARIARMMETFVKFAMSVAAKPAKTAPTTSRNVKNVRGSCVSTVQAFHSGARYVTSGSVRPV
jgi:hypothetical protein